MKIYLLRYCQSGYTDGIRLFTTLKAAQTAAKTCIGWGAYKATIYTGKAINNEIEYEPIKTYYKEMED